MTRSQRLLSPKLPAKFAVAFSDETRRNVQAAVTDLWHSCRTFTEMQEVRPTCAFGPARGAKMEILAAGWLDLAPPFVLAPGHTMCVTLRGV